MAVNKHLHETNSVTPQFNYNDSLSSIISESVDLDEDKKFLWNHRMLKENDNNWFIRVQNK